MNYSPQRHREHRELPVFFYLPLRGRQIKTAQPTLSRYADRFFLSGRLSRPVKKHLLCDLRVSVVNGFCVWTTADGMIPPRHREHREMMRGRQTKNLSRWRRARAKITCSPQRHGVHRESTNRAAGFLWKSKENACKYLCGARSGSIRLYFRKFSAQDDNRQSLAGNNSHNLQSS